MVGGANVHYHAQTLCSYEHVPFVCHYSCDSDFFLYGLLNVEENSNIYVFTVSGYGYIVNGKSHVCLELI